MLPSDEIFDDATTDVIQPTLGGVMVVAAIFSLPSNASGVPFFKSKLAVEEGFNWLQEAV